MPVVVRPDEDQFWQGDLFADVPWAYVRDLNWVATSDGRRFEIAEAPAIGADGPLVVRGGRGLGMLITHECVLDKQDGYPLAFARVHRLADQPQRLQEQIRSGQQRATFHLPLTVHVLDEDVFVDFRQITTLNRRELPKLTRIASLSESGREALRGQLIRYWTRAELPDDNPRGADIR